MPTADSAKKGISNNKVTPSSYPGELMWAAGLNPADTYGTSILCREESVRSVSHLSGQSHKKRRECRSLDRTSIQNARQMTCKADFSAEIRVATWLVFVGASKAFLAKNSGAEWVSLCIKARGH